MRSFAYSRPLSIDDAIGATEKHPDAKFLGGGTNLVDLMKMGVEKPSMLIDITRLPLTNIERNGDGVRIGAMARNSAVANHPFIRERYPVLAQALLAGASGQIRNMATIGGNLLQRTRCFYFYDPSYDECNKRKPGSGCCAISGYNRIHAILGSSDQCVAAHPSDMAVALAALDAVVHVRGLQGERSIALADFYRLPGSTPDIETDLKPGELIIAIDLPPIAFRGAHYLKVRDRNSFAFALASVAAIAGVDENHRVSDVRIALGGVAPKPWRVPEAELFLRGKEATERNYRQAAEILLRGAKTLRYNAFKVELARRAIVRALSIATEKV
jgi:xanthine dehydrogenase YagS FAD-binding subunit